MIQTIDSQESVSYKCNHHCTYISTDEDKITNISNRLKLIKYFLQLKKAARQDTVIFFGTGFPAEIRNDTGFLEAPISGKAGTKLKIECMGNNRETFFDKVH